MCFNSQLEFPSNFGFNYPVVKPEVILLIVDIFIVTLLVFF